MTPTPASAEPTEVEVAAAVAAMGCEQEDQWQEDWCQTHDHAWRFCDWSRCARALASQRAEIAARYEKVAVKLQASAEDPNGNLAQRLGLEIGARAIREAAPK